MTPYTQSLPWRVVDAGTEVLVSEHETEEEANQAWQALQLGSFPVYRVQRRDPRLD